MPERVDAGSELGKRKWLHKVVVATGLQPLDPVANAVDCGQEQDGRLDTSTADRFHDRQAVEPGKHPIDNQHIVCFDRHEGETVAAIGRPIDYMAFLG